MLVTIGSAAAQVDTSYTRFAYPARKTMLDLLENDDDTAGNVVIQVGSKGLRQATLSVVVETTVDCDLIRGYEEDGDSVEFVDNAGDTRSVLVYAFDARKRPGGDMWDGTVTLLETSDPIPAES